MTPHRTPIPVRIAALGLALVATFSAVSCGSSEPEAQPPSEPVAAPKGLPVDTAVVAVDVTRPATPTSIDRSLLPAPARIASQFEGLQPDEKVCVDAVIYQAVQADPALPEVNGKLAGLMGSAIVACMDPTRMADVFASGLAQIPMEGAAIDPAAADCLRREMVADPRGAATLIGSLLIFDMQAVLDAVKPFSTTCSFSFGP